MIDFQEQLIQKFNKNFTERVASMVDDDKVLFEQLFSFVRSDDYKVAWRAAWVCVTLCKRHKEWFMPLRHEMIEQIVLPSTHHGVRHQLLCIIRLLPDEQPLNVDLLDFCLEHMLHPDTSIAIQSLCIKIAHRMCLQEPELMREFDMYIDDGIQYVMAPAIKCTIKNIRKSYEQDSNR